MKKIINFCLISFFMMSDIVAIAQPGDQDNNGGGGLEGGDPAPAPINDKLILLAILGILYAIYKFKKHYKKEINY
jgi:hypothetical protein